MPGACRKDSEVAGLEGEHAPVRSAESHLPTAPRDTKDFVDARMIMSIVVDALAPRTSSAVAIKQVFKNRRRIKTWG
jgi:hypothetical protein